MEIIIAALLRRALDFLFLPPVVARMIGILHKTIARDGV